MARVDWTGAIMLQVQAVDFSRVRDYLLGSISEGERVLGRMSGRGGRLSVSPGAGCWMAVQRSVVTCRAFGRLGLGLGLLLYPANRPVRLDPPWSRPQHDRIGEKIVQGDDDNTVLSTNRPAEVYVVARMSSCLEVLTLAGTAVDGVRPLPARFTIVLDYKCPRPPTLNCFTPCNSTLRYPDVA